METEKYITSPEYDYTDLIIALYLFPVMFFGALFFSWSYCV